MACRLCGNSNAIESESSHFFELYGYNCPVCGKYAILGNLPEEFYEKAKFIASEKKLNGRDNYLIHAPGPESWRD